eukprot:SAG11_NODE_23310_length_389_cov_0.750000_1_plen_28_part_01
MVLDMRMWDGLAIPPMSILFSLLSYSLC